MDPTDPSLTEFLRRLATRGTAETGADEVVVSRVVPPDSGEVLHATDAAVARLEESAFALSEGPPAVAAREGRPTFVADLAEPVEQRRWPVWAPVAVEQGLRAVASFPVRLGVVTLGVVSFHRRRPDPFDAARSARAATLADALTVALLDVLAGVPFAGTDDDEVATVRRDLASSRVYQATGMVMVQLGVDATEALLALRVHAFAEGRSLREVAEDVVAHRKRFGRSDDPA